MRRVIDLRIRRSVDCILPPARDIVVVSPEHRHVFERRAGLIGGRVPVVAPAHLIVLDVEVANELGVVVGDTATATRVDLHGWR